MLTQRKEDAPSHCCRIQSESFHEAEIVLILYRLTDIVSCDDANDHVVLQDIRPAFTAASERIHLSDLKGVVAEQWIRFCSDERRYYLCINQTRRSDCGSKQGGRTYTPSSRSSMATIGGRRIGIRHFINRPHPQ